MSARLGDAGDRDVAWRDLAWLLLGTVGLSACITLVFLGMRAVMDIGGACASGGPYVSANPCPAGIGLVMSLAFPAGFGFAALAGFGGSRVGRGYAALPLLAWPALFISLGWNFIDYGLVRPPEGESIVWGWLIPGILFVAIGGVPLLLVLRWRADFTGTGGAERAAATRARLLASYRERTSGGTAGVPQGAPSAHGDIVGRLERLSALRASGDLTDAEFETAKAAVMREADAS